MGKKSRKGSQSRVALNSAGRSGPHPQRAATWADRWQAWGSVVAASVAILALIISIISIAIQIAAYRAEQDSRNLEYASRVSIRLIRENGDFVIENRSTAPLQYVTLTYAELTAGNSERIQQIFTQRTPLLFLQTVPPCQQLTLDGNLIARKIMGVAEIGERVDGRTGFDHSEYDRFFARITGAIFSDGNGRWRISVDGTPVSSAPGEVVGVPMAYTDPQIIKTGSLSDCGPR